MTEWLASRKGLIALTLVGLILRAFLAVATQRFPSPELAYIQADSYMAAATHLRHFGHIPDPLYVPAYAALCAVLQELFGTNALAGLITLQTLLDTACIPLIYLLTKKTFGRNVAGYAALLVTFDSLLIIQPALVLTEALYIPVLLAAVLFFVEAFSRKILDRHGVLLYCAAGVCAGVGALTRSVGLVIPIAFSLVLLVAALRTWRMKLATLALLWITFCMVIFPVCRANEKRYGHFSLSTSREFNMAVLMIGPAKASTMPSVGPNLMDMWIDDLGPGYLALPPYVLADRASSIAMRWAKAHPVLVAAYVVKGQLLGFIAPNRRSWAAALVWLHPSERLLQVVYLIFAGSRGAVAILALICLVNWRGLRQEASEPGIYFVLLVLLVLGHIAGAGAAVMGRYFCPVAPYMDMLAGGALYLIWKRYAGMKATGRNHVA